jgi:hypothetical protein
MKHITIFYLKDKETWSMEVARPAQEYAAVQRYGGCALSGKTLLLLPPLHTWLGVAFPEDDTRPQIGCTRG